MLQNTVHLSTQFRYATDTHFHLSIHHCQNSHRFNNIHLLFSENTRSFKYYIQLALPILVTMSIESSFITILPNSQIRYFSLVFKSTLGVHNMQTIWKQEWTMYRKLRPRKALKASMHRSESVLVFWRNSDKALIEQPEAEMSCYPRKSFLVSEVGLSGCLNSKLQAPES